MSETDHESGGETTQAKPVLSVEEIKQRIADLPEGAKERVAWEELGEGNISREAFRDLWLELRCQPKTKEPSPEPQTKKTKTKTAR